MSRVDVEREARATAVVAMSPFRDAEISLLAGAHMYRLEKLDQILVRLNVEHSGFNTINNHSFGSKFVEEVANPSDNELRWLTQSCIFYISGK